MVSDLESFGFVYMWCDRLKGKFYVGSHRGKTKAIKYKCGNTHMLRVLNKRLDDCDRVILEYCYVDDRNHLYEMEEKWLKFYDVKNNKNFYNHRNAAAGGGEVKNNPRKGTKMTDKYPNYVSPLKGRTMKDICGVDLPPTISPKPFRLFIKEPDKDEYVLEFVKMDDCMKKIKVSKTFLLHISIFKNKIITTQKNSKHLFPNGTVIKHEYVNYFDEPSPEETDRRKKLITDKNNRQLKRQREKSNGRPVGKVPQPYTITIYGRCGVTREKSYNTYNEGIKDFGSLENLKKNGVMICNSEGKDNLGMSIGDVIVYGGIDFKSLYIKNGRYKSFFIGIDNIDGTSHKIYCKHYTDFVNKTKVSKDIGILIRKHGQYSLKSVPSTSKHKFPVGTTFTLIIPKTYGEWLEMYQDPNIL